MKTNDCAVIKFDGSENISKWCIGYSYTVSKYWELVNAALEDYREEMGGDSYKLFVYDDCNAILARFNGNGEVKKEWKLEDSGEFCGDKDDFTFIFKAVADDCPIKSINLSMDYPNEDCDCDECCEYFCDQVKMGVSPEVSCIEWRDED